jgi:hypothetical protein
MTWTQDQALLLCRQIEAICPDFGCHVALTGGLLYKDGARKDADILFYRIRQVETIDVDGLFNALAAIGVEKVGGFGWCHKAEFEGRKIDCFFPEGPSGEYVRDDSEEAQDLRAEVAEWKADARRDDIMTEHMA